jgi:hypothetical protein
MATFCERKTLFSGWPILADKLKRTAAWWSDAGRIEMKKRDA